jgi:cation:H+ antiporter
LTYFLFFIGLIALYFGGEYLVRGASAVARRFQLSPMLIGLTIVGFGTSTPELLVSLQAALNDQPGIAIGNVLGSNIANILLILGISALIAPLVIPFDRLKNDLFVMLGVSTLLFAAIMGPASGALTFFALATLLAGLMLTIAVVVALTWVIFRWSKTRPAGGPLSLAVWPASAAVTLLLVLFLADEPLSAGLSRAEGLAMIILLVGYIGFSIWAGSGHESDDDTPMLPQWQSWAMIAGGLVVLMVGARLLVDSAVEIASSFGISEAIIGLTIVAVGTSLPEMATSVIAAVRGQREIAVGNIVGSNIYNILGILGITSLVTPIMGDEMDPRFLAGDMPWVLGAALGLTVLAFVFKGVPRAAGAVLLVAYGVYVWLLMAPAALGG